MLPTRMNWKKLFSYGEVVCFFSAWAIGLLMALSNDQSSENRAATRSFATTVDEPGVQATLTK